MTDDTAGASTPEHDVDDDCAVTSPPTVPEEPSIGPDNAPVAPPQRRGPVIAPILLGAMLLIASGLILYDQLSERPLAVAVAAPYAVILLGTIIALAGGLAARQRRRPGAN